MAESLAALMLRSAVIDALACKALDAVPDMSDTVIGFHAQQACEKCLKAVLSAVGVETTRTHDLARLLDLLVTQGIELPADAQWIDELTPYAVDARYGLVAEGHLNRSRSIVTVDALLDWTRGRLSGAESA